MISLVGFLGVAVLLVALGIWLDRKFSAKVMALEASLMSRLDAAEQAFTVIKSKIEKL